MYLRRERFSKGTYHKLNTKKIGLCKVLKQINENAYLAESNNTWITNEELVRLTEMESFELGGSKF